MRRCRIIVYRYAVHNGRTEASEPDARGFPHVINKHAREHEIQRILHSSDGYHEKNATAVPTFSRPAASHRAAVAR